MGANGDQRIDHADLTASVKTLIFRVSPSGLIYINADYLSLIILAMPKSPCILKADLANV